MTPKTVAIMQPTYLPWIGYFDLIDQSDTFVFLDSVQFAKRSWQQRNRIKTPNGELMLTVPVQSKGVRDQLICEASIDPYSSFHSDHLKAIQFNYAKSPYFRSVFDDLTDIYEKHRSLLVDLNLNLIQYFCRIMGMGSKEFIRSSTLGVTGKKVELLIDVMKKVGGSEYLSAAGSKDYIDENNVFSRESLGLRYHQFSHPEYVQAYGTFIPNLSIIDLIFNVGPEKALSVIRSGRK